MKKMKFSEIWGVVYITPDGDYACPKFTGFTRSDAIKAFNEFWSGSPNYYRKQRRKGKCLAVKLYMEKT